MQSTKLTKSQYIPLISRSKRFNNAWIRSRGEHFLLWMQGRQRQHFGPKSRIPDLFRRRDYAYFGLETQQLLRCVPPPVVYHDLLDAAAKVGTLEERIGYTFKDKMTCIEALKVTGDNSPLYFKGIVHKVDRHNRLALLGDRVLGLSICELWFQTGNSTGEYSEMFLATATRAALHARGRALNIHKSIIVANASSGPTSDNVAETFEAILGAVYIDSGYNVQTVKHVINKIGLDKHKFLKTQDERTKEANERAKEAKAQKNLEASQKSKEQVRQMGASREDLQARLRHPAEDIESQAAEQSHDKLLTKSQIKPNNKGKPVSNVQPQVPVQKPEKNVTPSLIRWFSRDRIRTILKDVWFGKISNLPTPNQAEPVKLPHHKEALGQAHDRNDESRLSNNTIPTSMESPHNGTRPSGTTPQTPSTSHIDAQPEAQVSSEAKGLVRKIMPKKEIAALLQPHFEERKLETVMTTDGMNKSWIKTALSEAVEELAALQKKGKIITQVEIRKVKKLKVEQARQALAKAKKARNIKIEETKQGLAKVEKERNIKIEETKQGLAKAEKERNKKIEETKQELAKAKKEERLAALKKEVAPEAPQQVSLSKQLRESKERTLLQQNSKTAKKDAEVPGKESTIATNEEHLETHDQVSVPNHRQLAQLNSPLFQETTKNVFLGLETVEPEVESSQTKLTRNHHEQKNTTSTKSIRDLEKDIIESHHDAWKQPHTEVRSQSWLMKELGVGVKSQPQVLEAEDVTLGEDSIEDSRTSLQEVTPTSKRSKMQMQLEETDTSLERYPEPEIYESEMERLMVDIAQNDNQEQTEGVHAENVERLTQSQTNEPPAFEFSFEKPLVASARDEYGDQSTAELEANEQAVQDITFTPDPFASSSVGPLADNMQAGHGMSQSDPGEDGQQTKQDQTAEPEIFESEVERFMVDMDERRKQASGDEMEATQSKGNEQGQHEDAPEHEDVPKHEVVPKVQALIADSTHANTISELPAPATLHQSQRE